MGEGEEVSTPAGAELVIAMHVKAGLNLKGIAKTVDGTGFAFTHLELPGKGADEDEGTEQLGNIEALKDYAHLRYVNLSSHLIADPGPLAGMSHLLSVNLSANRLTTASLEKFKEMPLRFLQVLNLGNNSIEEYAIAFPMLRELYLNNNKLTSIKLEADGSALKILDIRDNAPEQQPEAAEGEESPPPQGLQTCEGFGIPSLETLLLTGNSITSLKGLEQLTGVSSLDFSGNQVQSLEGLSAELKLSTLILRDCKIADWEEISKLTAVSSLRTLDVQGCPLPAGGNQRGRIVMRCPALETLDELPITEDDREAAKEGDPPPAE